ncbi:Ankyrin repeat domain-containing protein 50 [Galemys pyrenaicus]|uniref:Ankyrin repeat domain-containing protein 50 n=1 Tax=Galemys pyrenaicus TaxID=202257 RepID=A0A8J6DIY4_GALPY|nr:Ankyrin repeat domain-containing protein 50 [Galemys pyrenaicus]
MAQTSLLQGKPFYCREWVFHKLQHCLQEKAGAPAPAPGPGPTGSGRAAAWGVLLVGGPGSGKTALCTELLWPSSPAGLQRGLHRQALAFHFCKAQDADTLCAGGFVRGLVAQIRRSGLLQGYEDKLRDPAAQSLLEPGECERNPAEAFKRCVLLPLLGVEPPPESLYLLVDSVDEGEHAAGLPGTVAELLAGHHELFPPWLLLLCSARRQSRAVAKMFSGEHPVRASRCTPAPGPVRRPPRARTATVRGSRASTQSPRSAAPAADPGLRLLSRGPSRRALAQGCPGLAASRWADRRFRKISLDDLRKACIVKDVQQYILHRLDREEALRQHLTKETAEMLNQLHIKSSGCFLYLERVLDGVAESFIMLREVRDIPGTLNGLYLWLCQRLFVRKQFAKVQPILNVILAARRPLTVTELYHAVWTKSMSLSVDDFQRKLDVLAKLLVDGRGGTKTLFHHSFAEWLLDVKHCTQRYLCSAAEGHRMLAMSCTCRGPRLTPLQAQEFALHLTRSNLQLAAAELALWVVWSGAPVRDALCTRVPAEQEVLQLLVQAGARVSAEDGRAACIVRQALEREDSIRTLLDNGASVNRCDSSGRTLLGSAAYSGNLDVVNLLVSRGADLEIEDARGHTPLTLAARQGHTKVVNCLIGRGANVNHTDRDGWTALRSAAWGGHAEVVSALLRAGVLVDCADADSRTALRAAAWGGHEDIVLSLLRHGAEANRADREGRTALIAAAYMGHREIVALLLEHHAQLDHEDADGRTALSVAALCVPASKGHAAVVSLLLDRGAEVDHCDKDGMTPLLVAAYEGHVDVVELLLEGGADVDHADHNGRTPLLAAASMGHAAVVHTLLFWGAAVDSIDGEGRTVLSIASAQGNVEVVRTLLDRGLDENHRDDAGWTPLHMAAFEGHRLICEALMEQGARTNEMDNDGRIPSILAAQEGHYDCVQALLEGKSSVDHRGYDGRNALRVAALEGHRDVVELLLSHGADVDCKDADGRPTLYILALENQLAMAECLLEHGADVEASDAEGRTALHVSCWQGHLEVVRALLAHRADVNAADKERRSALQSAAWQGHVRVVQLLLERGAGVDHACNQGATALCIAAQEGHLDVVRVLLERGADPGHADQFGRTAMRVAAKNGHTQIIKLLEQHGAAGLNGCAPSPVHASGQRPPPPAAAKSPPPAAQSSSSGSTGGADAQPSLRGLPGGPAPAFSSPSESPDSTADRHKSSLSNYSLKSSKNSSLRTTSSTATAQTVPLDSVHGLSFTEQIQQHSLPRSRSRQSVASPCSTHSLGPGHRSPSSESEWGPAKASLRPSKASPSGRPDNPGRSGPAGRRAEQPRAAEYEMMPLDRRGSPAACGGAAPSEPQCPAPPATAQQGGEQKKRNGIVTNPNYHLQGSQVFLGRVSVPRAVQDPGHPEVLEGYPETELSLKQALRLQIESSDPSFSYKKETPLGMAEFCRLQVRSVSAELGSPGAAARADKVRVVGGAAEAWREGEEAAARRPAPPLPPPLTNVPDRTQRKALASAAA